MVTRKNSNIFPISMKLFTDTKMTQLKLTQVILMERDSEEVLASSYAGMFAYYREKVCTRFSKSA